MTFEDLADQLLEPTQAGIIPGKALKNLIHGVFKTTNPENFTTVKPGTVSRYVYGKLHDLPLNPKGSYSAFYNPRTSEMLYGEAAHSHDAMLQAFLDNLKGQHLPLPHGIRPYADVDERVWSRIRRIEDPKKLGQLGRAIDPISNEGLPFTMIGPAFKTTSPFKTEMEKLAAQAYEEATANAIVKALERKGLLPSTDLVDVFSRHFKE